MIAQRASADRLVLRIRPAPTGMVIAAGIAGLALVVAAALLREDGHFFLFAPLGVALLLPLIWAARPGPITVIDRQAGSLVSRRSSGRIDREASFARIEGVSTDRVTLPPPLPGAAGLTVYRTVLLTEGKSVAVQGFGAPAPARDLARVIEDWLADAPDAAHAH